MKTALDNYERGKQKESNADDYSRYIDYPKGRFICPECGEPVHLRPSKLNSLFFVHYKRTDENEECDRRVDGIQTESIYEKLGLPLFLRQNDVGKFRLYIGFKPLPESILQQASIEQVSVGIDNKHIFRVNTERFSTDYSVMIPVSYIPSWGKNYQVSISNGSAKTIERIKKHWPLFSDGFSDYAGALFSITSSGGRKIRHGDNVVTDTEYYWVMKSSYSMYKNYHGIKVEKAGLLETELGGWIVQKVIFNSEISDGQYRLLSEYLREKLRVHLIEKSSEFIPIWPPMPKFTDGYAFNNISVNRITGYIKSGNENPRVYVYRGVASIADDLYVNNGITAINPDKYSFVVNVDRKYSSSGTFFNPNNQEYVISRECINCDVEKDIAYITNLGGNDAIIYRKNGIIESKTDKTECIFNDLANGDIIRVIGNGYLFLSKCISLDVATNKRYELDTKLLMHLINENDRTNWVCVPYAAKRKLLEIGLSNPDIRKEVNQVIKADRISIPLLNFLEGII